MTYPSYLLTSACDRLKLHNNGYLILFDDDPKSECFNTYMVMIINPVTGTAWSSIDGLTKQEAEDRMKQNDTENGHAYNLHADVRDTWREGCVRYKDSCT